MSTEFEIKKPLHEVVQIAHAHCELRLLGRDTAVPYIVGPPGGGKSSLIKEYFSEHGYNILVIHFAFTPIEEISGLPQFIKIEYKGQVIDGTRWTLPDLVSLVYKVANDSKKVLLFMDDFHLCSPAHMEYGYQLFTDLSIRNYQLPENTAIVLAGNMGTKAGAKNIFSGIANRLAFYRVYTDFNHWMVHWAVGKVNKSVLSFLSESVYKQYFHGEEVVGEPWPSPRSWSRFSEILTLLEETIKKELEFEDVLYLATSHVGREAGSKFTEYYKVLAKLKIGQIFDTKKIVIPEDELLYTFILASTHELINRYLAGNKKTREDAMSTYVQIIKEIYNRSKEIIMSIMREICIYSSTNKKLANLYTDIRTRIDDKQIAENITKMIAAL